MNIVSSLLISCSILSVFVSEELSIRIGAKVVPAKSVQIASPIKAYFPGAIGVSMLSMNRNRLNELRPSPVWSNLLTESVKSNQPIDPENLRVRIVLSKEQILIDRNGRFIVKGIDTEDFDVWKGETREMRASQYVAIFGELEKLAP